MKLVLYRINHSLRLLLSLQRNETRLWKICVLFMQYMSKFYVGGHFNVVSVYIVFQLGRYLENTMYR